MPNGDGIHITGGGLGAPGQRVSRQETSRSEVSLPVRQCLVASAAAVFVYGILLVAVAIAGPIVAVLAGFAVMLYLVVAGLMAVQSSTGRAWISVVAVGAIVAWAAYGRAASEWLFAAVNWRPVAIGALLIFAGPIVLLIWRMLVEIVNPNWPPEASISTVRSSKSEFKPVISNGTRTWGSKSEK